MAEVEDAAVMSDKHRKILRKQLPFLVNNIEAVKLLIHLTDVLSQDDEEKIKTEKTRNQQAECLLDILPRRGSKAFECFVRALAEVQGFLAGDLATQGEIELPVIKKGNAMTSTHREILRSSKAMLQNIDLSKVLPSMEIVFDEEDLDEIDSKSTKKTKFDAFFDILMRKGGKAYKHFISVLKITNPSYAKQLQKESSLTTVPDDKGVLTNATQTSPTINPIDESMVKDNLDKLNDFYKITGQDDIWRRLAQELQVPQESVNFQANATNNPTYVIVIQWTERKGEKATVKALHQAVIKAGTEESLKVFEKSLALKPADTVDCPTTTNAIVKKIENMAIAPLISNSLCDEPPMKLEDLGTDIFNQLSKKIQKGLFKMKFPYTVSEVKTWPIRKLTNELRIRGMNDEILWMKKNLPAGVTGPLLAENTPVREMSYTMRSKLTIALCACDHYWKGLADHLGLENNQIAYFDSHRFKNPADEVLKQWETKRHSTVGELYDILVKLNMAYLSEEL